MLFGLDCKRGQLQKRDLEAYERNSLRQSCRASAISDACDIPGVRHAWQG